MKGRRPVEHLWRGTEPGDAPGNRLPAVGDSIRGPRCWWTVLEVVPVESRRHPNLWRARLRPNGPHEGRPTPTATWAYLGGNWIVPR